MVVVTHRLDVEVFELLSNVTPDLSVLKEGVKLNDFHILFFFKVELMEVETNSVESSENHLAQVELFNIVSQDSCDVTFIFLALALLLECFACLDRSVKTHR